jgi:hypothetical protein
MSFRICDFVSATAIKTKAAKNQNGSRATAKQQTQRFLSADTRLSGSGRPESTDAVTRHTIFLIEEKPCGCLT